MEQAGQVGAVGLQDDGVEVVMAVEMEGGFGAVESAEGGRGLGRA